MAGKAHWSLYSMGVLPGSSQNMDSSATIWNTAALHYRLTFLEFQCKGIGSTLIKPGLILKRKLLKSTVLEVADKEKICCYLETSSERSLNFFKKNGWKICKNVDKPAYGPRFWTMIRDPQ